MIIAERQSRLRDLLARRGMSDLESLSAELSVSQSTIRRDVELLVRSGHVKRTHGGVIWVGDRSEGNGSRPYAFDQRLAYQLEAKRAIAAAGRQVVRTAPASRPSPRAARRPSPSPRNCPASRSSSLPTPCRSPTCSSTTRTSS